MANRPLFPLATLLTLRESDRDQRQQELAESIRADEALLRQEQEVQAQQESVRGQARRCSGPGEVKVDELRECQRFGAVLKAHADRLAAERQRVQAEIVQRREAVVEANREVRALEILRDRHEQRLRAEEARRESIRLDEVALVAHAARVRTR